ncbi:hypothetical protein OG596_20430 [Streptomyces sp. NBC_01102]|uniref:hypothetical protein n=1 Tax=Streptomyces sp. NBC_01102 TaxID=2903749 RepID=UPI00386D2641|nr:hypothetical protein OG596_20430 [Streptomyces sp. NBC_01102]
MGARVLVHDPLARTRCRQTLPVLLHEPPRTVRQQFEGVTHRDRILELGPDGTLQLGLHGEEGPGVVHDQGPRSRGRRVEDGPDVT